MRRISMGLLPIIGVILLGPRFRRERMRVFAIALVLTLAGSAASAQTAETGSAATAQTAETCKARASEKKLAGAAMTSFMKKCERDAATTCDASGKDKKLAGAAKNSFTKKCVSDAVGT